MEFSKVLIWGSSWLGGNISISRQGLEMKVDNRSKSNLAQAAFSISIYVEGKSSSDAKSFPNESCKTSSYWEKMQSD